MLGVRIEHPFVLQMEVLEIDDHVPSMRMEIKIIIKQSRHTLLYEGACWFECTSWSGFQTSLRDLSMASAVLNDISNNFAFKCSECNDQVLVSWEFRNVDAGDSGNAMASFSSTIDRDTLDVIRNKFKEFPMWW